MQVEDDAREFAASGFGFLGDIRRWIAEDSTEALIYVGAGVVLYLLLTMARSALARMLGNPDEHDGTSWRGIVARVLSKTREWFLMLVSAEIVSLIAAPPAGFMAVVNFLFTVAFVIQAAIWVREVVIALIQRKAMSADHSDGTLANALGLIRLLVNIFVWGIALIVILDNLGVDVTALIAGFGIGGIAIGLAAQGIFADLFAALSIIFDKPFKKGDTINFSGTTGTVEAIGLKTTRLRALSGEQIVVSNTNLLSENIHNFALFQRRRVVMPFGVIYQTSPEQLNAIQSMVKGIVEAEEGTTFDRVHATGFGGSSIDYEMVFYSESADYAEMMQRRHNIMVTMAERFADADIDFAYPTQMGFLAGPDGKPIDPRETSPAVKANSPSSGGE
ncbi:small-conductance mechanosensitive channel [Pacificimonas flava]|uniref:Potassium efflux system KefA protein / Small-conductance mechanosensitive channel n=1 Tax=Pacificimonas flava TaxID=1234595 RepID=M2T662_9SPHN|nr:mechanosensitive ion channel family protein [Pacificimonas flava]EMD81984.1 Potassium efflux system KefA protein / Small-conductance mechanosensitive channel [Pacificimonas flava]MBB5280453.1 small-conductance mechanosensitive channel [Pacificimonas flava]